MMNDNEKQGLPTDFDLLEQAVQAVRNKPCIERFKHLEDIITKVKPQIKYFIEEENNE